MAGFEKTKLATGEYRGDYIAQRLRAGIAVKAIAAEINAPGFYTGPEDKAWPESVVYAVKRKLDAVKPKAAAPAPEAEDAEALDLDPATVEVPPEFEGILDSTDMAEVRAEAAASLRKKQRAQARKEALAKATRELERESRLAMQRGAARGDMVDVHIDLAPYAPNLKLDGQTFEHGRMYRVPRKQYNTICEMMQRSWQHQDGLSGKNERPYRRTLADRGLTANGYAAGVRA